MRRRLILLLLLLCSALALHAQNPEFAVISELPDEFADLDTVPAPQRYHSLHMVGFRYSYDVCNIASMPTVGEHILLCPVNFSVLFTYYHPLWDQLNVFECPSGTDHARHLRLHPQGRTAQPGQGGHGPRFRLHDSLGDRQPGHRGQGQPETGAALHGAPQR